MKSSVSAYISLRKSALNSLSLFFLCPSPHPGASILGGWGSRPSRFWAGLMGVAGGSWTGFGKHYSVFCTESMLETVFYKQHLLRSVFFMRKRENAGVKGEYLPDKGEFKANFLHFLS